MYMEIRDMNVIFIHNSKYLIEVFHRNSKLTLIMAG